MPADGLQLHEIGEESLMISHPSQNFIQSIEIAPGYHQMTKGWLKGQKIVVGGVWLGQYDPQGISDCRHLYTLYNYDTKEFIRFDY